MGELALLPDRSRYDHLADIVEGLAELVGHGTLFFDKPPTMVVDYDDAKHSYKIDGAKVPSATTILDATEPKPALQWWGFRVGMAAVLDLVQNRDLSMAMVQTWDPDFIVKPIDPDHPDAVWRGKGARRKLKSACEVAVQEVKTDPYNRKAIKGTLGDSIHKMAETTALTGEIPDIDGFPEADQGYVQAFAKYFVTHEPEVELQEVIVASKRFGFAGRFDCVVRTLDGRRGMRDYKTSGGVYSSFDKQLSLYDIGWLESGQAPLDFHEVVHLRPDGTYEIVPLAVDHADALVALLKLVQDADLAERLKALGRKP